MCARSFALVVALLLVVAQCAEVKSIQNQFEFLLNTAMVEKANAGYKPSVLNIPGSELLADNVYSASGFLTLTSSYESTCSTSFKSQAVAVGSCITENSISYKFQLVEDSCAGAVVQYFFDDACSLYAGSSEFEESAMTCGIKGTATARHEYTSLTCSIATVESHTAALAAAAPSMEPTAMPTTRPTQPTTAYPTAAAPNQVSFVATQTVTGVSLEDYNSDPDLYETTLKQSIALTMDGVSADNIQDLTVTASNTRVSASLRSFTPRFLTTSAIVVSYRVVVETLLTSDDLIAQLTNAVNSGDFTSILQSTATANGATGLESASSDSIEVESTDSSSDDELSGGAVAGIVIGVVVGVMLISFAFYYLKVTFRVNTEDVSNRKIHYEEA